MSFRTFRGCCLIGYALWEGLGRDVWLVTGWKHRNKGRRKTTTKIKQKRRGGNVSCRWRRHFQDGSVLEQLSLNWITVVCIHHWSLQQPSIIQNKKNIEIPWWYQYFFFFFFFFFFFSILIYLCVLNRRAASFFFLNTYLECLNY